MELSKNQEQALLEFMKSFEGTKISLPDVESAHNLIGKSKEHAKRHQWLYHCTNATALRSIIRSREFWANNLREVNDKDEVNRIDVAEYKPSYYVSCFTYEDDVSENHWKEYGNTNDSVLIGLRQEWFRREPSFLTGNNEKYDFPIHGSYTLAISEAYKEKLKCRIIYPYYVSGFDFYQIVYDDDLRESISSDAKWMINGFEYCGTSLVPSVAGIIKKTKGLCARCGAEPYEKAWSDEKEVRLKIGIEPFVDVKIMGDDLRVRCPRLCIPLTDVAFDTIKIRFSPKYDESGQVSLIKELQDLLPESTIEVLG